MVLLSDRAGVFAFSQRPVFLFLLYIEGAYFVLTALFNVCAAHDNKAMHYVVSLIDQLIVK